MNEKMGCFQLDARDLEQTEGEEIEGDSDGHADGQRGPKPPTEAEQPRHEEEHRERRQDKEERAGHVPPNQGRVTCAGVEPDEREELDEWQRVDDGRRGVVAFGEFADADDERAGEQGFDNELGRHLVELDLPSAVS